jgi:Reverse transcriptase (RNA-dependent DNA polymerase)
MLTSNAYVRVIALDFSKAFDTVRHVTLFNKLSKIDVPDEIYNWMRNSYDGRTHFTIFNGEISKSLEILSSVVQGSALGPAAFIVTAADLKTLHSGNKLMKYADDTCLVFPAVNTITVQDELN